MQYLSTFQFLHTEPPSAQHDEAGQLKRVCHSILNVSVAFAQREIPLLSLHPNLRPPRLVLIEN